MNLIDTHAHLDEQAFANDRDEVIERAFSSGISAILTIGITAQTSVRAVEIANQYPNIFAVVGIQPNYVSEVKPDEWKLICDLAKEEKVVAIGETGLDKYWDFSPLELQSEYFTRHLELAEEVSLPFIIHCREAEQEVISQLQNFATGRQLSGVMHSFCGDENSATTCLDLGLHLSFSGMLTYKKNEALRSLASTVPLDRLLVETDAPYLAPVPKRGKRNEPAYVEHTAACLAELHNLPVDKLAEITTRNACELFKMSLK